MFKKYLFFLSWLPSLLFAQGHTEKPTDNLIYAPSILTGDKVYSQSITTDNISLKYTVIISPRLNSNLAGTSLVVSTSEESNIKGVKTSFFLDEEERQFYLDKDNKLSLFVESDIKKEKHARDLEQKNLREVIANLLIDMEKAEKVLIRVFDEEESHVTSPLNLEDRQKLAEMGKAYLNYLAQQVRE